MQPVHATSDGGWVGDRIGPARVEEGAYVWRKLLASGAALAVGTDVPVEDIDPIANYYAAVTRRLADGRVFSGDQRLTRLEALRAFTLGNAFAAFEESIKGSLSVGKLADVTVLSKDITVVPDDEIRAPRVVYTIVGGQVRYVAAGLRPAAVSARRERRRRRRPSPCASAGRGAARSTRRGCTRRCSSAHRKHRSPRPSMTGAVVRSAANDASVPPPVDTVATLSVPPASA